MSSDNQRVRSIDPDTLPKHFEAIEAEKRWDDRWEAWGTYRYDPTRPRDETFVVDTPPPTVSGSLHIGHIFSYTHTDTVLRSLQTHARIRNVFYPMGWDDNGVPTERRVQNYYHVRCDPRSRLRFRASRLEPATAKQRKDRPREIVSRQNFIELCHDRDAERTRRRSRKLWRRAGLSVDWTRRPTPRSTTAAENWRS